MTLTPPPAGSGRAPPASGAHVHASSYPCGLLWALGWGHWLDPACDWAGHCPSDPSGNKVEHRWSRALRKTAVNTKLGYWEHWDYTVIASV